MTCGIICKQELDYKPMPSRRIHWVEQEPDLLDRILRGFLIFLCIITFPVLIAAALVAEFVL